MPSSRASYITDVEEFRAAIGPGERHFVVTGRGDFAAGVTSIQLNRIALQRICETLGRTWRVEEPDDRVGICFSSGTAPPIRREGVDLMPASMGLLSPGGAVWVSRCGRGELATMSLPAQELAELGTAIAGRDLRPMAGATTATAPPAQMKRLRALHGAAVHLAETAPEIIANAEAARGLEASLVDATVACLWHTTMLAGTVNDGRHSRIMKSFLDLAEASEGQPLYIAEVCATLHVTQRTLHAVCEEQLGIGPKRYLLLRRVHLAHQALLAPLPGQKVTEIATRYGFWELGRFAGFYRSVFGEAPSATLHGRPDRAGARH